MLEDVKEVIEFAKAGGFFDSPPGNGDRELFVAEKAQERFREKMDYFGLAHNFFYLGLS